ncbi:PD40 domain-containing protein [Streptomyces actinomycinicus]|uniref:PD40 domain-containing protein n=1 Tax=Streptomyces actinomycinicus TaxID=1695166 RepID=A0A937JK64_9ACTN|nr:PD40 domain-containing protein [Streptomyces actinomycinicus]MBL1080995.1 PD40 domain-containing protein [Streptomyces actinomycinicus]
MDTLTHRQRTDDGRTDGKARRTGRAGGRGTAGRRRAVVAAAALAVTVPLTLGAAGDAGAAAADHSIVFARYTATASIEDLYAVSPSGGTPVELTHTPTVSDVMPSWSPDGKRVAFVRYGSGGAIDGIWTMKTTGAGLKAVPGTKGASDPAWSPDGKRLAYARPVGTQREIYVADVDGTPAKRLTHTTADDLHPTWSPDGTYLAFNRADAAGHSRVMRIRLSTLAEKAVTPAGSHDWTPDWSRTGRIAFSRVDASGFAHLYLVRPDGSGVHRITSARLNDKYPSWSPDGSRLVFTRGGSDDADPEHLFLVRADGTGLKQLTKTDSHDLEADWRP